MSEQLTFDLKNEEEEEVEVLIPLGEISLEEQLLALQKTLSLVEDFEDFQIKKQFKGGQEGEEKENVFKSTQELLTFLESEDEEGEEEASTSKKFGEEMPFMKSQEDGNVSQEDQIRLDDSNVAYFTEIEMISASEIEIQSSSPPPPRVQQCQAYQFLVGTGLSSPLNHVPYNLNLSSLRARSPPDEDVFFDDIQTLSLEDNHLYDIDMEALEEGEIYSPPPLPLPFPIKEEVEDCDDNLEDIDSSDGMVSDSPQEEVLHKHAAAEHLISSQKEPSPEVEQEQDILLLEKFGCDLKTLSVHLIIIPKDKLKKYRKKKKTKKTTFIEMSSSSEPEVNEQALLKTYKELQRLAFHGAGPKTKNITMIHNNDTIPKEISDTIPTIKKKIQKKVEKPKKKVPVARKRVPPIVRKPEVEEVEQVTSDKAQIKMYKELQRLAFHGAGPKTKEVTMVNKVSPPKVSPNVAVIKKCQAEVKEDPKEPEVIPQKTEENEKVIKPEVVKTPKVKKIKKLKAKVIQELSSEEEDEEKDVAKLLKTYKELQKLQFHGAGPKTKETIGNMRKVVELKLKKKKKKTVPKDSEENKKTRIKAREEEEDLEDIPLGLRLQKKPKQKWKFVKGDEEQVPCAAETLKIPESSNSAFGLPQTSRISLNSSSPLKQVPVTLVFHESSIPSKQVAVMLPTSNVPEASSSTTLQKVTSNLPHDEDTSFSDLEEVPPPPEILLGTSVNNLFLSIPPKSRQISNSSSSSPRKRPGPKSKTQIPEKMAINGKEVEEVLIAHDKSIKLQEIITIMSSSSSSNSSEEDAYVPLVS